MVAKKKAVVKKAVVAKKPAIVKEDKPVSAAPVAESKVVSAKAPKAPKASAKKPATKKASKPAAEKKSSGGDDSKKMTFTAFIVQELKRENRFYSTPEISEAAFVFYGTEEAEKSKVRSTIQKSLHRLADDNQIKQRKKLDDRLSYWALPKVADGEFQLPDAI